MTGKRQRNDRLRSARVRRGWSQKEAAERAQQLAAQLPGHPELSIDDRYFSRWEAGAVPHAHHIALLCQLYGSSPAALGLPGDHLPSLAQRAASSPVALPALDVLTASSHLESDSVDRRDFTKGMIATLLVGVPGLGALDWERLASLPGVPTAHGHVDGRLLDDLQTVTTAYAQQWGTLGPNVLLPAARSQLAILHQLTSRSHPPNIQLRLLRLTSEAALLVGWLSGVAQNFPDADAYYTLARNMALEAGANLVASLALAASTSLYSTVYRIGCAPAQATTLGMLHEAESLASSSAAPQQQAWLNARLAEEHASAGHGDLSGRHLERAEAALSITHDPEPGFLRSADSHWLGGFRGNCALLLGRSTEAAAILEDARAGGLGLRSQQSAVLTDLAVAYAQQGEAERASTLLAEAFGIASQGHFIEQVQRVMAARGQLTAISTSPAVRQLDEQLRDLS